MENLTIALENTGPHPVDVAGAEDGRATLDRIRADEGIGRASCRFRVLRNNAKLKLDAGDVHAYGVTLAPASTSGIWNTCSWSTAGCEAACILDYAYQRADNVRDSRRALTRFLAEDPAGFLAVLADEIEGKLAEHGAGRVAVRLNTASDLRWERFAPALFERFAGRVMFYDYTKAPAAQRDLETDGYALTFSVSERARSLTDAAEYLRQGHGATVVLPVRYRSKTDKDALPAELESAGMVDHDVHDVRSLDRGRLGMLRAKGSARSDESGFVRTVEDARRVLELAGLA